MDTDINSRAIIHLDMDAFYAAVEVLDNPALRGKPVIVGGGRERGVVSSASYEARRFGVRSAQPIATAMRLCPDGIFVPVRMDRYKELSGRIFKIYFRFTPLVEPLSIDEAFLDVTGSIRLFGTPETMARQIKATVVQETGLTVSAGVAPSKLLAKIASDMDKPDGLTVVPPDRVREFLDPLPIGKLWGVGRATEEYLTSLGIKTIGDLSRMPEKLLASKFGQNGLALHRLAQGLDDREVTLDHEVKSVGREETFAQDITELNLAKRELLSLAGRVAWRMRRKGLTGRTISLKVKYYDFVQITRAVTMAEPTDDGPQIYHVCRQLMDKNWTPGKPIRLLGISVSQLYHPGRPRQLSLFGQGKESQKRQKLNTALDSIYRKFGEDSVRPGTLFTK
ncbi:MAG: DNA polymerase IV [Deltaproteobacteria bacterium]|nr:DNA polymerase IV [Deltaproteobacteria bacterium]